MIFEGIDKNLLAKFKEYHTTNPHVYDKFEAYTFEMANKRDKYSAWTIINKIRWEHDISTEGEAFKINNDYIALYARLVIYRHPGEFDTFFELRRMKPEDRRDCAEERYRNN